MAVTFSLLLHLPVPWFPSIYSNWILVSISSPISPPSLFLLSPSGSIISSHEINSWPRFLNPFSFPYSLLSVSTLYGPALPRQPSRTAPFPLCSLPLANAFITLDLIIFSFWKKFRWWYIKQQVYGSVEVPHMNLCGFSQKKFDFFTWINVNPGV